MTQAILIDVPKCTGCGRCVQACDQTHGLEPDLPARKLSADGLSSRRLATVLRVGKQRYVKK